MGKVSVCLKWSYIIVASLIGIISALLLAFTLFTHGYFHEDEEIEKILVGLHVMYVISFGTLVLTIIGVFGACKEKKWALIVFAVGMILASLFMFGCQINAVAVQPQLDKVLEKHFTEYLDDHTNSSENGLDPFNNVQTDFQCCGLVRGYVEWGSNIPKSCKCTEESTNPCVAAPRNSSLYEDSGSGDQPIMIYEEPCLAFIIKDLMNSLNIALGITLGYTLLWVLAVVLCIIILCRLNQKTDSPTVVYSQEAKAGNYSVLEDATDHT